MTRTPSWQLLIIPGVLAVLSGAAISAQDKYTVQVPGGLSLSECRGYVPDNGKPFPDGSKIVKIHWKPKQNGEAPFAVTVPDTLLGLGCMVKDSKRFADSGGWGWAQFDYDPASAKFTPNTSIQGNDAKCGFACHTPVKAKDYVFTAYPTR